MFEVKAVYIGRFSGMRREHVAATFANESAARDYALFANCKAFSPYFYSVQKAA